jgi:hypothetical protein
MKPSIILNENKNKIKDTVSKFSVNNLRVFGSVVHGSDTDGSDLDLLVDALPGTTIFDLTRLQLELEDMLGIEVDLLTPKDISPRYRNQVLAEAVSI